MDYYLRTPMMAAMWMNQRYAWGAFALSGVPEQVANMSASACIHQWRERDTTCNKKKKVKLLMFISKGMLGGLFPTSRYFEKSYSKYQKSKVRH